MQFTRFAPLRAAAVSGLVFLAALALTGCGRDQVSTYEVPKDAPPGAGSASAGHAHGSMTGMPGHGGGALPRITWEKLPDGWQENPAPGPMRAASFLVRGAGPDAEAMAEFAAIPMTGLEGMDLELVNMWRGQVKLPAVTEAESKQLATEVVIAGEKGRLYDMGSTEPVLEGGRKGRIVVAMLAREGTSWFFKLAGEDEVVAGARPAMVEFLKSIGFAPPAPVETAGLPPGHPPMGGGMGGMGGRSAMRGNDNIPPGVGERPHWHVPPSWTEVARSQFLVAKFQARDDAGGVAEINVSRSAGAGGGWLMNVNRWRAQLGLDPQDQAALDRDSTTLDTAMGKATVVDFTGADAENHVPSRCVGVMVPQPGETWFYKLMGPTALVTREREAFLNFVRTVNDH